jgi:hypothetical protein
VTLDDLNCRRSSSAKPPVVRWTRRCVAALALLLLVTLSGCDGCRWRKRDPTTPPKKPEPKLPDFQAKELRVLPTDATTALQTVKPGHWFSVQQELKSNRADFFGELDCRCGNQSGVPIPLRQSSVGLHVCRPVSLPKGQSKTFELTYFVGDPIEQQRIWLYSDLRLPFGGAVRSVESQPAQPIRLKPYQAELVVLARRPDAYGYLKTLPSIRPPASGFFNEGIASDYDVSLVGSEGRSPVPSWPLMWTTISYLVWDGYDPELLTPDQRQALLDWLHWGGQILVSGPDSLDTLQTSFLADYLPARAGSMRPLQQTEADRLNQVWGLQTKHPLKLNPQARPQVIQLTLESGAEFTAGSADLVAERRVGRGRIVMTSFALTTREFVNWDPGWDNFFNACLLRRPPRRFLYSDENGWSLSWVKGLEGLPTHLLVAAETSESDPLRVARLPAETLLTSRLRFFSRDARQTAATEATGGGAPEAAGFGYDRLGGVAGWNDLSDCSRAARAALTSAAGINVPERQFVLWTLSLYLFVLVPANWALFRALGRVEWAWVAVPFLAIAGTWFVVHRAQLDIGFVRSRCELAILEVQPEYSRGHLTRYIGLYTSLSTSYALSFASDSAVSLPFSSSQDLVPRRIDSPRIVTLRRLDRSDESIRLEDFLVSSASTGMVHSEEMWELGGTFQLTEPVAGRFRFENPTPHALRDLGVFRRYQGGVQVGWVGECDAEGSARFQFRALADDAALWTTWTASMQNTAGQPDSLSSPTLVRLAVDPSRLHEGDVRAVGWLADELAGLQIRPEASQRSFRTLLVANLRYGPLPAPESDENAPPSNGMSEPDDRVD